MKKKYNTNNLYVGQIMYISNEMGGPFYHETKLKYIFEAKKIGQPFYEEVFTKMKIQREITTHNDGFDFKNFNTPYIVNLESFINYFPNEINKEIYAKNILLRMNEINSRQKEENQQPSNKVIVKFKSNNNNKNI